MVELKTAFKYLKQDYALDLHRLIAMQTTLEEVIRTVGDLQDKSEILLYLIDFLDEINKQLDYIFTEIESVARYNGDIR